jgi:hypothetical protein
MSDRHVPFPGYVKWCALRGVPGEMSDYEAHKALAAAHATNTHCVHCKRPFTDDTVHTEAGWQETQISGLCEDCFDDITHEDDEDDLGQPGTMCSSACGYCGRCT